MPMSNLPVKVKKNLILISRSARRAMDLDDIPMFHMIYPAYLKHKPGLIIALALRKKTTYTTRLKEMITPSAYPLPRVLARDYTKKLEQAMFDYEVRWNHSCSRYLFRLNTNHPMYILALDKERHRCHGSIVSFTALRLSKTQKASKVVASIPALIHVVFSYLCEPF